MEIFLITAPGLEGLLAQEAREVGLDVTGKIPGGVTVEGGWPAVWTANLKLRGATRVLLRLGSFYCNHLAQLDKQARRFDWADHLPQGATVSVETTCRKSKIYHAGAATQRVETALQDAGFTIAKEAPLALRVRIENNLVTLSLDTSGESLHRRGHKQAVNKAPLRETLAALFLRAAGFNGRIPLYDPMCGSGTLPIEAAERAMGLDAGRARGFAFEQLDSFDANTFATLRSTPRSTPLRFYGTDRDAGAIKMAQDNATRAGIAAQTQFHTAPISAATPPCDTPGLVIVNPPYGGRIGNKGPLYGLYGAFGARMLEHFSGWRVAMITSEQSLAQATKLPFGPPGPVVNHGGIKVRLWQTKPLP